MAETDEKAKYAQVPQSEEHAAKEKEQPEEGAVRLQAKMGLVMISNNMQYTVSHGSSTLNKYDVILLNQGKWRICHRR